jgi:hypothetical protein
MIVAALIKSIEVVRDNEFSFYDGASKWLLSLDTVSHLILMLHVPCERLPREAATMHRYYQYPPMLLNQ